MMMMVIGRCIVVIIIIMSYIYAIVITIDMISFEIEMCLCVLRCTNKSECSAFHKSLAFCSLPNNLTEYGSKTGTAAYHTDVHYITYTYIYIYIFYYA